MKTYWGSGGMAPPFLTSPVTVAERSKACTVFARSEAGFMSSNPAQGMNVLCVCVNSVFVLSCV
jgi:hypothetical protein